MLSIREEKIELSIYTADTPLRIVHMSDFHAELLSRAFFDRVITEAVNLKPDLVLLTGDFFHANPPKPYDWFISEMKRLTAICPVYACLGNHDCGYSGRSNVKLPKGFSRHHLIESFLTEAGVNVLRDQRDVLTLHGVPMTVVGLDDYSGGERYIQDIFQSADSARLCLTLVHDPNGVGVLQEGPTDVLFCGHTHGGQIRMPFTGWNICHLIGYPYHYRLYKLPSLYMNVNPGIVALRNFRFNCPPEISVIEISHKKDLPNTH